jgi:hypothetical protein
MKVILTAQDLLPLIQDLLEKRYPQQAGKKVVAQFVMKRKSMFSSEADVTVECELSDV